jgi:hypothetical protein
MAVGKILNSNLSAPSNSRHSLWLAGAFASGFVMLPLATACLYLPVPFGIMLILTEFIYATPATYPLLFVINGFWLRHKNGHQKHLSSRTIFLMALGQAALVILGAATFYLTVANIPFVRTMLDEHVVVVAP